MINSSVFDTDHGQVYYAVSMKAEMKEQNKEVRECQQQVRNPARARTSAITAVQR